MLLIKASNTFEKDAIKMRKRGKDIDKLEYVISTLVEGKTLPAKYRNHKLVGNYQGLTECHIEPDWLLVYEINDNILYLIRTGTHSDLFWLTKYFIGLHF